MNTLKLSVGPVLSVVGGLVVMAGVSLQTLAIECIPDDPIPTTICDQAQPVDHYQGNYSGNLTCSTSGFSGCEVDTGSECGDYDGYEVAEPGMCVHDFNAPPYASCIDNYGPTWVPLKYVVALCDATQGPCSCRTFYDGSYDTQYSEVCDCF